MIKTLLFIILILVTLGLFGVSVERDVVQNENVQENVSYVSTGAIGFWNTYLREPARWVWEDFIVGILWETFARNMGRLRDGQTPIDFTNENLENWPSIPQMIDDYNANNPR
jgi:hypothetical protein